MKLRKTHPLPSIELLRDYLIYDPATGALTWRKSPAPRAQAGRPAGSMNNRGYRKLTFLDVSHLAHRVVWAIHYGEWPTAIIDHINGDKADNRIANLRLATPSQNGMNRQKMPGSVSRFKGVYRNRGKWQVYLRRGGIQRSLGRFASEEDAGRAYDAAIKVHDGEFAVLNFPDEATR